MRLFIKSLVLILFSCAAYAQGLSNLTPENFKLEFHNESFIKGLPIAAFEFIDNSSLTVDTVDITSEFWDTNVYNPYKEAIIKYPFQIQFEDSTYSAPILKDIVVTSRYGWRRGRAHKGIDIDLVTGDEVVSLLDGIVRFANYNRGHGKTVVVRHFNGLETTYAHLSKYAVKVNDTVRKGQLLGKGGATGNARGSHLHLVVRYQGIAINPEYLFDFNNTLKIRSDELWVTRKWTSPYYHSSRQRSIPELFSTEEEALASLTREKKIYVVKRGDTLSHIARRNNTTIRSICVANNISTRSLLKIGQKLLLEP
ncbi:MAG: peptidoglycan DD-metalloendopeptidase family protein [Bacteroidia bacterium]|nr:peptidoglycan DD-metalloendopeptidase family protein [Bacteroidia bacterium]